MQTTKLIKSGNGYYWVMDIDQKVSMTDVMGYARAKSFGVWWLKIRREQVDAGFKLMADKHNTAIFSELGDFLYVDNIPHQ
jgi:hypothetical protein